MTHPSVERAYEIAKANGFDGRLYSPYGEFLDPAFWQALGKGLGWSEETCVEYSGIGKDNGGIEGTEIEVYEKTYLFYWHHFIDHLAEKKDPESFFSGILNQ